jgi:hypothetical protein
LRQSRRRAHPFCCVAERRIPPKNKIGFTIERSFSSPFFLSRKEIFHPAREEKFTLVTSHTTHTHTHTQRERERDDDAREHPTPKCRLCPFVLFRRRRRRGAPPPPPPPPEQRARGIFCVVQVAKSKRKIHPCRLRRHHHHARDEKTTKKTKWKATKIPSSPTRIPSQSSSRCRYRPSISNLDAFRSSPNSHETTV